MLLCLAASTNPQSRNGSVSDFTFVAIVILRQARLDGTDATQSIVLKPTIPKRNDGLLSYTASSICESVVHSGHSSSSFRCVWVVARHRQNGPRVTTLVGCVYDGDDQVSAVLV